MAMTSTEHPVVPVGRQFRDPFVGHEGMVSYKDRIDSYGYAIPSNAARRAIDRTALKLYFS